MGKKRQKESKQLGHLPPQHDFFLNPHTDARFTRCPKCDASTKLRKKPLLIIIDPIQPVSLNKTCRYCPNCDLLIAHQDELDRLVQQMCLQQFPQLIGHDYFVVGTMDRQSWKEGYQGKAKVEDIFKSLHDFKRYLEFEPARYVWGPADSEP